MACWLLKTEPSTYSYDDLERERRTTWDGVKNPVAQKHIRAARRGDLAVVYHTGSEKQAVGVAELSSDGYEGAGGLAVFDLAPRKRLVRAVTLAELKAAPEYAGSPLVRQGRLSVVPLEAAQWKKLLALAATRL